MARNEKVQIIPLGGLGEIGKNMTIIRFGHQIIIVDCGVMFPEDEMLGIDVVIPDITYLLEHRDEVLGIFVTHGHEDHIGALPYVLREIPAPVYGTRLTLGLLEGKVRETNLHIRRDFRTVRPRDVVTLGPFSVEFLRVSHSLPDSVALAITTPAGLIVHTGDFKFDQTPVDREGVDYPQFAKLGEKGVLLLLSDSTNVESRGFTPSERQVGKTYENVFRTAKERVLITTFPSNIHRLQQAFAVAHRFGRKVAVVGRSMQNAVDISFRLGYLEIPRGTLISQDHAEKLPRHKVVLIASGTQGEPLPGITRLSGPGSDRVEIYPGDTVIVSASPVPGNEKLASHTINHLFRQGADVIFESTNGHHISGHASQEELKLMLNLLKPQYFMPIQGEYRMLVRHGKLAHEVGINPENVFVTENGYVLEFSREKGAIIGKVPAGRVLVDGLGVGDVGNIVLRDRKQLSQDGILIAVLTINRETGLVAAGPDFVSRGFVYVRESEALMEEAKDRIRLVMEKARERKVTEWTTLKASVREVLSKFFYEKTRRRPMILPILMEV